MRVAIVLLTYSPDSHARLIRRRCVVSTPETPPA
jgi:hypothetical protein